MSLISLHNVDFDHGRSPVLREVGVDVFPGVKYALVGINGAGKTTLLDALAGELSLPTGARQVKSGTRIGVLHQESILEKPSDTHGGPSDDPTESGRVLDCVTRKAFAEELTLATELEEVNRALMASTPSAQLVQRQGQLQAEFERRNGYTMQSRLEAALRGVGLDPHLWDLPLERLSGGERRRAALAAILLGEADVLLLDEPTNHLDLQACEWLEGFLRQYQGAAVLVSHDRQFLDRVTERTLHLQDGRLTLYNGNYSFFDKSYRQRLQQQRAAYRRQQEYIRRAEDYIQRNIAGQKTKQAQSRRKQLAREVRLEKPPPDLSGFRIRLQPSRNSGGMVLEAEKLTKRYGDLTLFHDLDLRLSRGDRLGIIGPNGCGKSTLLKVLSGKEGAQQGVVRRGHNVDLGYYDQELASISDHNTVLGEMAAVDPAATQSELRGFLGAFGFDADMIERPVGRLSGGERSRLALLRLIKEGHNTLLLDEPTNHLDVLSREALEEALQDYEGTLVVVSHDRRFLNHLVDRLCVFHPAPPGARVSGIAAGAGEVRQYLGNYEDYRHRLEQERARADEPGVRGGPGVVPGKKSGTAHGLASGGSTRTNDTEAPGSSGLSKNEQARRRQWIADVEEEIADLEAEKEKVLMSMSGEDLSAEQRMVLGRRCSAIDAEIAAQLTRWEQWNLELQGPGK